MKYSLGISNFLEEISSLPHYVVFLYFFALITEEGFLISPCYSLELCIKWVNLCLSPLLFTYLLFTAICKASSDSYFAFLHSFFLGLVLLPVSYTCQCTNMYHTANVLNTNNSKTVWIYSAVKKNSFESVVMRWMKLEPIIQSEVSQKEKHQYSILTHIYGI